MQIHALWWPLGKLKVSVGKQPSTPLMHDVHKHFANEMWLQLLVSNNEAEFFWFFKDLYFSVFLCLERLLLLVS